MAEIWLLLPSSLHWEICLDGLWDPFQELLEMVPSTGTSSCLRTNETAFSDCEVLISTFAGVSFFFHCWYVQCFSHPFLPIGISICYICTVPLWNNPMLAKGQF